MGGISARALTALEFSATTKRATLIAKILLAPLGVAALLYWATQERSFQISTLSAYIFIGACVALASVIPFALRLRQVLRLIDFDLAPVQAVRIITQSMFYYFFIPLSVGTEISKFAKLKALDRQRGSGLIAAAIVLDHIVGLFVLIALSISLYVIAQPNLIAFDIKIFAVILLPLLAVLLVAMRHKKPQTRIDFRLLRENVLSHKLDLCIAAGYSLLMHGLIAAAVTIGATQLHVEISYIEILFVLTGAFLFQLIPLNFVGVSAIEVAGAGLYLALGLEVKQALMLVSLLYCYRILIALIGGSWEFLDASLKGTALKH